MVMHQDLHLFNLGMFWEEQSFIDRVMEYNPNHFSEGQVRQI